MGYQISYSGKNTIQQNYEHKRQKKHIISVTIIFCAILLSVSLFAIGRERLWEMLVPGDNEITITAFHNMQDNLETGMSAGDAIAAFCSEILQSANTQ